MKKTIARTVSVLLVAVLLFSMAGCGAKGEIRATIKDFQYACNEMDIEAALECINPSVYSVLKLGAGLLGSLIGQDAENVFASLSSLLISGADTFGVEAFKTLKIKVNEIAANDTTASAKVTLIYDGKSGEEKTSDATINLKCTDEGWKIDGIRFD